MLLGLLFMLVLSTLMAIWLDQMFHDVIYDGGILAPRVSPYRMSMWLSWIIWLFLFCGEGLLIYITFFYLKFGLRRVPATILIMNDQGVYLLQLRLGQFIPWADVESYEIKKYTTMLGVTLKTLVFKIRNRERYLTKNWRGAYPVLEVRMFGATESLEDICQCLDEYLRKNKWPASPAAERNA
jgi:hypothetical protein